MNKRFLIFAFFSFCFCIFHGQNTSKIHLTAESQFSQIRLRWAVSDFSTWQLANRYGYTLERYEILNHQNLNSNPERRILNIVPIKPADSTVWKEKFDEHQSYAILSQALFGESFSMSFQANHPLFTSFSEMQQDEQRFSMALLAADQNFDAACLAGLGWIDKLSEVNRTYLYRVYVNAPDSLILCDTAKILIATSKPSAYPKITDISSESGDKSVFLSWSIKHFQGIYNSYTVEKSEDKKHFVQATNGFSSNISDDAERAFFIDTLKANNQTYYYRIYGTTVFGTKGPVSEIVQVVGKDDFTSFPEDLRIVEENEMSVLQWDFDENFTSHLSHFSVFHQTDLNAGSSLFSKISAQKRNCVLNSSKLEPSNYFTVTAVYKNGQERPSFACFHQLIDTLPPAAPIGLLGIADSAGIVKLRWLKNTESDLEGYRVFRANRADQEVVQISKTLCLDTVFYDTISTNTSKSMYYQITAEDKRGNGSAFSMCAEVKRVNLFPPPINYEDSITKFSATVPKPLSMPRIKASANRDKREIVLRFQADYSISEIQLFRKKDDESWYLLETFSPVDNTYRDTQLDMNSVYYYRLKCTDNLGNHSPVSDVIRLVY